MGRNVVETLMGALVLLVAGSFIVISYKSGNISTDKASYVVIAKFTEIGSLTIGSDVRVGGIKVGTVVNQSLDNDTFMAVIKMGIQDNIQLPKDSSASVVSDGLLGSKYISIEPGGDDRILKNEDEIKYTQDSINFESLIGKFAFGSVATDDTVTDDDTP